MFATAFFDGTVSIHNLQSTNESAQASQGAIAQPDGGDPFGSADFNRYAGAANTLSLKQPPKWLRTPVGASFGFAGKLVSVSNLPSAQGKPQSQVVHLRKIITEPELIERADKLQTAVDEKALQAFAEERVQSTASTPAEEGWKALLSLFKADSRDELVTLLGFSKSEIAARVAAAVETLKASKSSQEDEPERPPHESVVSFAEPESQQAASEPEDESSTPAASDDRTPSELSAGVTSDFLNQADADGDSQTTAPSLFGDDAPGTPHVDFFSTVGVSQDDGQTHPVHVPHTNYGIDSSVAATAGSRPSSVTSETIKSNAFKIYPSEESDTDRLLTKALVLGDFESAVSLCLSTDRFADAILFAAQGSRDLLSRTQKTYVERQISAHPYLRVFQSIATNDLNDIVQNADLQDWKEIFVVICTFASQEDFAGLAEVLGRRLEEQYELAIQSGDADDEALHFKKTALLTYLASGRLERLISIWSDELVEEEKMLIADESNHEKTYYSAHAEALQSFIEKVSVFRAATDYKDEALDNSSADSFKLSSLYDRYFEYADILSSQGLVQEAARIIKLTPPAYSGPAGADFASDRKRFIEATSAAKTAAPAVAAQPSSSQAPWSTYNRTAAPTYPYQAPSGGARPPIPSQPISSYAPSQPSQPSGPYAPSAPSQPTGPYAPPVGSQPGFNQPPSGYNPSLTQPPHLRHPPPTGPGGVPIPAPPPSRSAAGGPPPPGPALPPKAEGWNDPPKLPAGRSPPSLNLNKPAAITAPFPNSPGFSPHGSPHVSGQPLPPPPRPGSVNRTGPPPPRGPPQGSPAPYPPQRPPTTGPPPPPGPPSHLPPAPRAPTPSQYAPPPSRGPAPGQTPPPPGPGQFGRPPIPGPPAPHAHGQPPAPNPYARATSPPVPQGPYAPQAGIGGSGFSQLGAPPPPTQPGAPPAGPYGPPGGIRSGPPSMGGPPGPGGPPPPGGPARVAPSPAPPAKAEPVGPKYRKSCSYMLVHCLFIMFSSCWRSQSYSGLCHASLCHSL